MTLGAKRVTGFALDVILLILMREAQ